MKMPLRVGAFSALTLFNKFPYFFTVPFFGSDTFLLANPMRPSPVATAAAVNNTVFVFILVIFHSSLTAILMPSF